MIALLVFMAMLCGAVLVTPAAASASSLSTAGRYIVVFKDSVAHPGNVAEAQTEQRDGDLGFVYRSALEGYSVSDLSKADVEALRRDPRVDYVEPDGIVKAAEQTIPVGISRISATKNEALDIDGVDDIRVNVDVAVIDSGIEMGHPDLNVFARTDCGPAGEPPGCVDNIGVPGNSHGTHVAGAVGAIDNGIGVVGVAPGARLWSVRVLDGSNFGLYSWVIAGIDWVTAHASEIEVANMSLGGEKAPSVEEAIKKAVEKGVVVVVAAGNSHRDAITTSPASSPDVITVSGMADYDGKPGGEGKATCQGADDGPYNSSNWGKVVDIVAPGVCVYSTVLEGKYASLTGTSFASPHVAGAAAVLASTANPNSEADVKQIRQTLIDEGSLDWTDNSEDGGFEPVLYIGGTPLTKTEVATGGTTSSNGGSVTLTGALNPRGLQTEYKFEYGPTTEYGQSAPAPAKKLTTGAKYTEVSEVVTGLKPDQTYHFRLVASNSSGTFYGKDKTFIPAAWTKKIDSEPTTDADTWLEDVSCATTQFCLAVGHYHPKSHHILSYEKTGSDWHLREVSVPSEANLTNLVSVSCSEAKNCTAVGSGEIIGSGKLTAMAMHWDGSEWSFETMPSPSESTYVEIRGISCPTSNECVAAGWYRPPGETARNYSARWNGSSWTALSTPNHESIEKSVIEDVHCPKAGYCVAVGWYNSLAGPGGKVALIWDGSSWKESSPASANGPLVGVTCSSSTHCLAVNNLTVSIERWNGSEWLSQEMPTPSDTTGGGLEDISCASSSYCVAVGYSNNNSNGVPLTFAVVWNGSFWRVQSTARISKSNNNTLTGVSCFALARCAAVGWSRTGEFSQPLVETLTPAPIYQLSFGSKGSSNGQFNLPLGMAVDKDGNVWVADHQNDRIQKFNSKGEFISKFGTSGAGSGQLDGPGDIAIDKDGNLWVVEGKNYRVQKFSPSGEYLSGFGSQGSGNGQFAAPACITIDQDGDIWVTDYLGHKVKEFKPNGEFIRTVGGFGGPQGVAVGEDNHIWVADMTSNLVKELSPSGEILSQFGSSGEGNGQFKSPAPIDVLPGDRLLVGDITGRVQEFSSEGQYVTQFGSGQISQPSGVTVGPEGLIYVASAGSHAVKKWIEPSPPLASTDAATAIGNKGATLNATVNPHGLSTTYQFEYGTTTAYGSKAPATAKGIGSGSEGVKASEAIEGLKLGTNYHFRVVATNEFGTRYGEDKTFTTSAPQPLYKLSFGSKGSSNGQFNLPLGMAVDKDGNVWVADHQNDRIQKFNSKGEFLSKFGTSGSGSGQLDGPGDIAIDKDGNLWVVEGKNYRVQKFSPSGEYLAQLGSGQLGAPACITLDQDGDVWVTDYLGHSVEEFKPNGELIRSVNGVGGPQGVAVDEDNHIWVVDNISNLVRELSPSGEILSQFGSTGEGNGQFKAPAPIDVLSGGRLLVGDSTGRVQEFSSEGQYVTQFGSGQISQPSGIATSTDGVIYVASAASNSVQQWVEPSAPKATTGAASGITTTKATLNATVNPHGLSTTYQLEYGTTTAYGSKVPVSPESIGSGASEVAVSKQLEGLSPSTTYHFRVVATNELGTTHGADKTFKTT